MVAKTNSNKKERKLNGAGELGELIMAFLHLLVAIVGDFHAVRSPSRFVEGRQQRCNLVTVMNIINYSILQSCILIGASRQVK